MINRVQTALSRDPPLRPRSRDRRDGIVTGRAFAETTALSIEISDSVTNESGRRAPRDPAVASSAPACSSRTSRMRPLRCASDPAVSCWPESTRRSSWPSSSRRSKRCTPVASTLVSGAHRNGSRDGSSPSAAPSTSAPTVFPMTSWNSSSTYYHPMVRRRTLRESWKWLSAGDVVCSDPQHSARSWRAFSVCLSHLRIISLHENWTRPSRPIGRTFSLRSCFPSLA